MRGVKDSGWRGAGGGRGGRTAVVVALAAAMATMSPMDEDAERMESAAPGEAARELSSDTDTRSHESVSSSKSSLLEVGFSGGLASGARRSRSSAANMARVEARPNRGRARA